ncbi:MAG TPA: ATP-dependent endonuclease, partial [Rikenellaceae bacterium]|nr:ATP-dependent endonuclease [Rikenellaceae bacterium]
MAIDQYILDKLRSNLPFSPSSDQDIFFKALSSFLTGTSPIFILNGYAGTGKTTAMAALVGALAELNKEAVLLAPTGRSAKVLMGYAGAPAHTIHKAIYRQKAPASSDEGGFGVFELHPNRNKNTLFIVDEASLLSNTPGGMLFGSGNLLEDMVSYVFKGQGNQLLILGDSAQLPPVGLQISPALDPGHMEQYGR